MEIILLQIALVEKIMVQISFGGKNSLAEIILEEKLIGGEKLMQMHWRRNLWWKSMDSGKNEWV